MFFLLNNVNSGQYKPHLEDIIVINSNNNFLLKNNKKLFCEY